MGRRHDGDEERRAPREACAGPRRPVSGRAVPGTAGLPVPGALRALLAPLSARAHALLARRRLKTLAWQRILRGERLQVVVGSAGVHGEGWLPTDRETLDVLNAEDWERLFPEGSIDAILAEHVWEHLTLEQGIEAAAHCFAYLKPGGFVRVAVPDGFHASAGYVQEVRPGGTGAGAGDHKVLYTYRSLGDVFAKAGFQVTMLEYHDEEGEFHDADWDPGEGMVHRSKRFDPRNRDGQLRYTSIIADALKPPGSGRP
jgi:predicted SAM-dependent methyltransferase